MKKDMDSNGVANCGFVGGKEHTGSSAESVTVEGPIAFAAAPPMLPAGTYKIRMLTKGRPGVREVEVIAPAGHRIRVRMRQSSRGWES